MTQDNTIWQAAARIRRTQTHIPVLKSINKTTYTNTEKAELIANSLRSQFTLNSDVENPRVTALMESTVSNFLNENINNTLSPATPT